MKAGSFDYRHHFPNSPKVEYFTQLAKLSQFHAAGGRMLFSAFANLWLDEKRVEWRASQIETVEGILRCHLIPAMETKMIATICKQDILGLRLSLCEVDALTNRSLSASRINHIMTYLRLILNEAAERFGFQTPWRNIKALPFDKP